MSKKDKHPTWTEKDLEQLKKEGKIRGYNIEAREKVERKYKYDTGRIVSKIYLTDSKEKNAIITWLFEWTQQRALILYEEYRFHPERQWRFDWLIKDLKLAVEFNGIMSEKSRHTTVTGYTGDMDKINAAQALGYRVIQLTPLNYNTLLTQLNNYA